MSSRIELRFRLETTDSLLVMDPFYNTTEDITTFEIFSQYSVYTFSYDNIKLKHPCIQLFVGYYNHLNVGLLPIVRCSFETVLCMYSWLNVLWCLNDVVTNARRQLQGIARKHLILNSLAQLNKWGTELWVFWHVSAMYYVKLIHCRFVHVFCVSSSLVHVVMAYGFIS